MSIKSQWVYSVLNDLLTGGWTAVDGAVGGPFVATEMLTARHCGGRSTWSSGRRGEKRGRRSPPLPPKGDEMTFQGALLPVTARIRSPRVTIQTKGWGLGHFL